MSAITETASAERAPVELKPRGIGELLDAAVKVVVRHRRALFGAVLVVIVPAQILSLVVTSSTYPETSTYFDTVTATGDEAATFAIGQIVVGLITFLMTLVAVGACYRALVEGYLGGSPGWRESVGFAFRRIHSVLWITIIYSLACLIGFVLLILPFFWVAVAFSLVLAVHFSEGLKGFKAMGRSANLVSGRWWATFGLLLVAVILYFVLSWIIQFGITLPVAAAADDSAVAFFAANAIASTISATLTIPFLAAVVALSYFDLRIRKEGLDLEVLASRIGIRHDAHPATTTRPAAAGPQPASDRPEAPGWTPPPSPSSTGTAPSGEG